MLLFSVVERVQRSPFVSVFFVPSNYLPDSAQLDGNVSIFFVRSP